MTLLGIVVVAVLVGGLLYLITGLADEYMVGVGEEEWAEAMNAAKVARAGCPMVDLDRCQMRAGRCGCGVSL